MIILEPQTFLTLFILLNTLSYYTTLPAPSKPEPADTAIDKLLKSNASLDEKLDAIEKTLDKMLEELIKIEKNLEAIQASLKSNSAEQTNVSSTPAPKPNSEDMVIETEAKTEVEVVANNPMAEVPIRTDIETEVVAEAKTETEATEKAEVPEITVDSAPDYDIDREMADLISSYEGDLDQLNDRLKIHQLQINLSEDRHKLSVCEIDNGVAFLVFEAQAEEKGWKISSQINDSTKLDILERFVEAEEAVITTATAQVSIRKVKKVINDEPSLFL